MMARRLNVLAIIPARGGSKRLPGKNIKPLLGKPLINWTIEQALQCHYFDKVIVSTDCKKIAEVAKEKGASVPFIRPDSLSQDRTPSIDVVEHALDFFSLKQEYFDVLVLLEPTSPLRTAKDLNNAMTLFIDHYDTYDALISVGKVEREHPSIMKLIEEENFLKPFEKEEKSQKAKEAFFPYGVIYASKVSTLREMKTFYPEKILPYCIQRWQNFEIDDEVDFLCIEKIMEVYSSHL